jgi:rod shape-determining protein MreD
LGDVTMSWRPTMFVLAAAFVAVFLETSVSLFRNLLGAQIDLLPALMVYAALTHGFKTMVLLAVCGGLWFDSLSLNPLGVSVLPLLLIGLLIYRSRDLLLREHIFAQVVLGVMAGAAQPLGTLFILLNAGMTPLLGWVSLWRWVVLAAGRGAMTTVCFKLFDRLHWAFEYQPVTQTSFRPDREIKRGRAKRGRA